MSDRIFFGNVRDLAGLRTKDGKKIASKKIVRGNLIDERYLGKISFLKKSGVSFCIDLRRDLEREKMPSVLDVKTLWIPLNNNLFGEAYHGAPTNKRYVLIVEENKEAVKKVFDAIYENIDECIYIHCAVGKDRTGIIVSLLLMICNVLEEDLVSDYSLSKEGLKNMNVEIMENDEPTKDRILYFVKYINDKYENAFEFLKECGVEDRKLNVIKEKLVN